MKKRIILVVLSAMLCLLCGCLEDTPLTDEEMDIVAEYAASLLLKYDSKYSTPLYYENERTDRLTPTPFPTEKPAASPVPAATTAPTNAPGKPQPDTPAATVAPDATATPTPVPYNHEETTKQLTEIFATENITVTCEKYELMKSVQSTEYFSLVAKEGRQYAVVTFTLHNGTDRDLVFDASEKGLEYSMDININTQFRVSLSMLENDLQYMPITVPARGTAEAVLVFEIEAGNPETIHLIIEDENAGTVFVKLK